MIVIISGPPAVGKTTVAKALQSRLGRRGTAVRVLDSDQFSRNTYDQLYDHLSGSTANWIVAGTFYKRRWQERFAALPDVIWIALWADLDTCLERNQDRSDPIDDQAVHVIWNEFQSLNADLTIDTTEESVESVVAQIVDLLESRAFVD